ncbi:MAG TPA: phospholipid carrier-dependent glycosyltransferase [Actinocrinis sp.]|nr:phospholipid carrier-dependent glycosyltransferase [Actinocrinis sp.]
MNSDLRSGRGGPEPDAPGPVALADVAVRPGRVDVDTTETVYGLGPQRRAPHHSGLVESGPSTRGPAARAGSRRPRPGQEHGRNWMRPAGTVFPPPRSALRERLVPAFYPEFFRGAGWVLPLAVTLIGGFMRFWNLGKPDGIVFDETYYAKDGWSMYVYGWEHSWVATKSDAALAGTGSAFGHNGAADFTCVPDGCPEYVVHPPFGKWVIGAGEKLWGFNPVGWRVMEALLGTVAIYILARTGRRMFRSTLLGTVAGLFLAFDGLAFVMARTALLDGLLMFWVLAGFSCLVVDRDQTRARFAAWREERGVGLLPVSEHGPRLGIRPWRLLAGLCLGLAAATKWNGVFFCFGFVLLSLLWDAGARRAVGVREPRVSTALRDLVWAVLSLPALMVGTFVASYAGWFFDTSNGGGYFRFWAAGNPSDFWPAWTDPLRSLWHYVDQQYLFNANQHVPHPYQSNPWSWLVMGRPVAFYYCGDPKPGYGACPVGGGTNGSSQEVLALGNPLLWWVATAGILFLLWRWIARRDWRAGAILCGIAWGIVPWMHYAERTIFSFYAVAFAPFMALSATMVVGAVLGRADASSARRSWGAAGAGTIVVSVVALFIYFYPLYTGQTISTVDWSSHMWFQSWV